MSQFFQVHPDNPQARLINRSVDILRDGGVIAYPTDSSYALGCHIGDKASMERIARIRQVSSRHNFTLVCRDLSEISTYAKVGNQEYRLMKSLTPGPFTFILKASREVPRRLQNPKRKTIGLRVPENRIAHAMLEEHGEPIMSSTLILPNDEFPMTDAEDIREQLEHLVDLVIDGGHCVNQPTTVVDLSNDSPAVTRQGRGIYEPFN